MKKTKIKNKQINLPKYLLICSIIMFLLGIVNLFIKNKSLGFANISLGVVFFILCAIAKSDNKK